MACSYLHLHLGGTHTSIGKRSAGNSNRLVETDKFLNQGGEKLNVGGFQAWLGEWIGKTKGGENWGLAVNTFDDYIEISLPSVHFQSNPWSLLDQPKQANPETDWLVSPGCACLARDRLRSASEDSGEPRHILQLYIRVVITEETRSPDPVFTIEMERG